MLNDSTLSSTSAKWEEMRYLADTLHKKALKVSSCNSSLLSGVSSSLNSSLEDNLEEDSISCISEIPKTSPIKSTTTSKQKMMINSSFLTDNLSSASALLSNYVSKYSTKEEEIKSNKKVFEESTELNDSLYDVYSQLSALNDKKHNNRPYSSNKNIATTSPHKHRQLNSNKKPIINLGSFITDTTIGNVSSDSTLSNITRTTMGDENSDILFASLNKYNNKYLNHRPVITNSMLDDLSMTTAEVTSLTTTTEQTEQLSDISSVKPRKTVNCISKSPNPSATKRNSLNQELKKNITPKQLSKKPTSLLKSTSTQSTRKTDLQREKGQKTTEKPPWNSNPKKARPKSATIPSSTTVNSKKLVQGTRKNKAFNKRDESSTTCLTDCSCSDTKSNCTLYDSVFTEEYETTDNFTDNITTEEECNFVKDKRAKEKKEISCQTSILVDNNNISNNNSRTSAVPSVTKDICTTETVVNEAAVEVNSPSNPNEIALRIIGLTDNIEKVEVYLKDSKKTYSFNSDSTSSSSIVPHKEKKVEFNDRVKMETILNESEIISDFCNFSQEENQSQNSFNIIEESFFTNSTSYTNEKTQTTINYDTLQSSEVDSALLPLRKLYEKYFEKAENKR
ncbi:hypothetical protein ABK040_010641 [Willaertia magna]